MPCRARRPPDLRLPADLAARFAALEHLHDLGLCSEAIVHALFENIGWCSCPRCLFDLDAVVMW